jgi:hypothetical protein
MTSSLWKEFSRSRYPEDGPQRRSRFPEPPGKRSRYPVYRKPSAAISEKDNALPAGTNSVCELGVDLRTRGNGNGTRCSESANQPPIPQMLYYSIA